MSIYPQDNTVLFVRTKRNPDNRRRSWPPPHKFLLKSRASAARRNPQKGSHPPNVDKKNPYQRSSRGRGTGHGQQRLPKTLRAHQAITTYPSPSSSNNAILSVGILMSPDSHDPYHSSINNPLLTYSQHAFHSDDSNFCYKKCPKFLLKDQFIYGEPQLLESLVDEKNLSDRLRTQG